jgi:two-component system LytT family response regulator
MIRCIVIEDEPLALRQMVSYIEKTPFLELGASFDNALDALTFLNENETDLMFVDINLPDLNGMDFVKSLKNAPKVVFTTAYREYAVEGFRVDALDYLVKPISYADFLQAANRAAEKITKKEDEFLLVKSEYKSIRINLADILYIEGMREYVRIHLAGGARPVMTLLSMKSIEQRLPSTKFMRIHRSYIVNLARITTIERNRIVFDKEYIPVGDQYKDAFQKFVDGNFLAG